MNECDLEPLSTAVGRNVRRLRQERGTSLADLAVMGQLHGARWSASAVAQIESGKYKATIELLVLLAGALSFNDRPVTLFDLVKTDSPILVSDHFVTPETLRHFLCGNPFDDSHQLELRSDDVSEFDGRPTVSVVTEQERRAAHDLGVTPEAMKRNAMRLWGRPFAEERDARAGDGANAQKRGRITRELKDELRAGEVDHGDD